MGKLGSKPLGPCQILLPVSVAYMKAVEELEMCQVGLDRILLNSAILS